MNKTGRFLIWVCFCSGLCPIFGQLSIWDGETDNNWHKPENWSGDTLPAIMDSVIISAGTVEIDAVVNIKTLQLINGTQLTVNEILTLSASSTDGIFLDGSTVTNNSKIDILVPGSGAFEDRAIEMIDGSVFNNFGTINIKDALGFGIRVESGSVFTNGNSATIIIAVLSQSGISILSFGSVFENNGEIEITLKNNESPTGVIVSNTASFVNHNTLKVTSEALGSGTFCLRVNLLGQFVNTGDIELMGAHSNVSIFLSGIGSSMDIQDGNVQILLDSSQGIQITGTSSMNIDADGQLSATGTILGSFFEIAVDGTFECQGSLQFGN